MQKITLYSAPSLPMPTCTYYLDRQTFSTNLCLFNASKIKDSATLQMALIESILLYTLQSNLRTVEEEQRE